MRRRDVVAGIGAISTMGCVDLVGNEVIRNVEWWNNEKKQLEVTFVKDHEADLLVVAHSKDAEFPIIEVKAPRFSGPIRVPFLVGVSCDEARYPSNEFFLMAVRRSDLCCLPEEAVDTVRWRTSDKWLSRAYQYEHDLGQCALIEAE